MKEEMELGIDGRIILDKLIYLEITILPLLIFLISER